MVPASWIQVADVANSVFEFDRVSVWSDVIVPVKPENSTNPTQLAYSVMLGSMLTVTVFSTHG